MIAYVAVQTGGHRATPQWTVHNVRQSEGVTSCGQIARSPYPLGGDVRPQGKVKVCGRCFTRAAAAELETRVNGKVTP